ncbi:phosphate ABC transporter permease PstA [Halorarius litoreus]|uniref:phosphate ABC transporter permease PstA n=1 Tax=Halorarius litoreus TaxID=2962676 RepID=UPI0020CFAE08|nr:phosphate ABC transporter permease PstA [Halorarius litoreus]
MATEDTTSTTFGEVSRTRGIAFKYLLLAATLFGLVALGVLLVYVALDAFGFNAFEDGQYAGPAPAWFLVYFLTLVLPTTALSLYYYRENRRAGVSGVATLGVLFAGVMASGGAVVFFVVVSPVVYLSYVVALLVTAAVFLAHRRYAPGRSFEEHVGLTALVGLFALVGLPEAPVVDVVQFVYGLAGLPTNFNGIVGLPVPSLAQLLQGLPVVPTTWSIYLVSVALPGAAVVGGLVYRRDERRRPALLAGGLLFATVLVGSVAGSLLTGADRAPVALAILFTLAPVGYVVDRTLRDPERDRRALLFPLLTVGGALFGAFVVRTLAIRTPPSWVDWQFLTSLPSSSPTEAGVYAALVGSVLLMLVVVVLSFPVGVGAAVYLEEYADESRFTRFIQVNISNLAGVPSVVYGLLGLGIFIRFFGLSIGSLLVAGMALSLLILPIVIISAQEAIRSVPDSLRQASYGMGATKWQTVREVVLPRAFPGIMTGTILALGRAVGETAPLIIVGAAGATFSLPTSLSSTVSALPMQIYSWAFLPDEAWRNALAAGVVVILVVMLTMNATAIVLRNKYENQS